MLIVARVNINVFTLLTLYGLTFSYAHFLCIRHLSMFTYITDTSRAVGVKEQREHFAYKVGVDFTLSYVTLAFGTSMIAFVYAAFADFTP